MRVSVSIVLLFFGLGSAQAADKKPIDVIEDNGFLVEEAYNQEAGMVQHIFTAAYNNDTRRRGWDFSFTQEWPVFSQDHQFSYTIPWSHFIDGADRIYGVSDATLSYRYQALEEDERRPALAPRFTLILPTGNRDRGAGNGVVGYEWSLPFSKKLASRFAMHANFDVTYLPGVRARLDGSRGRLSPKHSLVSYKAGASGIFAVLPRFHLMLEWIGDFEESIDDRGKSHREFKPMIAPGFRAAAIDEEKMQIVVGAAVPVGLNRKADNHGVFLYLSVEHSFF